VADETQNRAELEYTARVNRESFARAREEVRRETEQAVSQSRQAASTNAGGTDPELEAIRRERAERTRLIQERNAARIAEQNQARFVSDEEFRIMSRLNAARNRADEQEIKDKRRVRDEVVKLASDKAKAEEQAYRSGANQPLLYPGSGAANFNLSGGYKSNVLASLSPEEYQAFKASQGGGAGGGGGGGGLSGGYNRFAQRRVIAEAGYLLGVPELGQVGSLAAYGPEFAAAGAGIAGAGALVESVKLYKEQQDELHKLTTVLHDTDQAFSQTYASAEIFATTLGLSRVESEKLAESLAQLNLKAGLNLGPAQAAQLGTVFAAHGLSPEEQASTLKQISQDASKAFEDLTGLRADVTLDNYARSIGKTTSELTRMEKQQVLVNELLHRSGEYTGEAEARLKSFSGQWERFVSTLKDVGGSVGQQALYFFNSLAELSPNASTIPNTSDAFGGYAYRTTVAEFDAQQAAENRRAIQRNKDKQAVDERVRQQQIADQQERAALQYRDYFSDRQRENIAAGRFSESAQFKSVVEQRDLFERGKGALSTDDAKKFGDQFDDVITSTMQNAKEKVFSFSKTFRDQFGELATLALGEKENPYVKIFSDGELAAARAREQFGLAGDEVVNSIVAAQKAMQNTEVYELRLKDNLSAVKLEFQAAELAKPFTELTREMKNTIAVFNLELKSAVEGPKLLFQARQLETGGYASAPNITGGPLGGFSGQTLETLRRLRIQYGLQEGIGGEELNHLINQQYIQLYQGLSPGQRRDVFQFGTSRLDFANAFRGEERYGRDQIERQLQRNIANSANVRLAQTQLQELSRLSEGQDKDVTRRAFLDITGTLSREELTPDLIKGRASALQEEARFQRGREERARKAVEDTAKFQNAVAAQLQQIVSAISARNDKVIVEVLDRTDTAKVSTLGQGFQ
jgi:hypothetical protein